MQIRPIRTDKDHRAALAEIEKLWGASSGTPEGDKLDILVTLVETYEERPGRSRAVGGLIRWMCCTMRSRNLVTVRRSLQTFWVLGRVRPKSWLVAGPSPSR